MWLHGVFLPYWSFPALILVGVAVSFINAIAGGGGILSFSIMLFLGMPASLANGSNRLGILLGSAGSTYTFHRQGNMQWRLGLRAAIPAALGSMLGAWLAVKLPERLFNPILAMIIISVVIATVKRQTKMKVKSEIEKPYLSNSFLALMAYAAVGFYGGFLQIGIGFIMMYVFGQFGRLNIFQINAIKAFTAFLYSLAAILFFAAASKINWPVAVLLAVGNLFGGILGSHWQVKKGEKWVNRFLIIMGLVSASKLIWDILQ